MSAKGPANDDPNTKHVGISDTISCASASRSAYSLAPEDGKHTIFGRTHCGNAATRGLKKTSVPSRPGNRRSVVGVNHPIPDQKRLIRLLHCYIPPSC